MPKSHLAATESVRSTPDDQHADDADCKCEPDRAIARLGNMRPLYANVVGRFLDDSAGNYQKLLAAIATKNATTISQTAHSLKGLAAMCGAVGLEGVLAELETAPADEIESLQERLEPAMRKTRSTLAPFRDAK